MNIAKLLLSHYQQMFQETQESVKSFKFLGVHISADLTWTSQISYHVGKAKQRLLPHLLPDFYQSSIVSILACCTTLWFTSCTKNRKDLQQVERVEKQVLPPTPSPEISSPANSREAAVFEIIFELYKRGCCYVKMCAMNYSY